MHLDVQHNVDVCVGRLGTRVIYGVLPSSCPRDHSGDNFGRRVTRHIEVPVLSATGGPHQRPVTLPVASLRKIMLGGQENTRPQLRAYHKHLARVVVRSEHVRGPVKRLVILALNHRRGPVVLERLRMGERAHPQLVPPQAWL